MEEEIIHTYIQSIWQWSKGNLMDKKIVCLSNCAGIFGY